MISLRSEPQPALGYNNVMPAPPSELGRLPDRVRDLEHLESLLSEPTPGVIDMLGRLDGDILVLGVGGKMGPSLARMAKRASDVAGVKRKVIGVSRFSSSTLPRQLNEWGIETMACDLLNQRELDTLPNAPNIVYMAGMKFGSTGQQARTWAMNTYLPGMVAQKFKASRIVAFSTGNVYPITPVTQGGCIETDEPRPIGDYAQSALGRERMFEHFSRTLGTAVSIIRLNYAVDMRYGVLVDLAQQILRGDPVDLAMGNFNCIWQADANAASLQSFDYVASPAFTLNVTGPETVSVRRACEHLGRLMNKPVNFSGTEAGSAFLNNAGLMMKLFGYPRISLDRMLEWIADWVGRGGETLGKPTHFETRDGKF